MSEKLTLTGDEAILAMTSPEGAIVNFATAYSVAITHIDLRLMQSNPLYEGAVAWGLARYYTHESAIQLLGESTRLLTMFCEKRQTTTEQFLSDFGYPEITIKNMLKLGRGAMNRLPDKLSD